MVTIHEKTAQTFDTLGLGALLPSSCVVTEELNGAYELEMEHPYDEKGKWKRIEQERILYASTPRGLQPFRIYNINPDMESIKVNARHIFYDLLDNLCYPISITGSAKEILYNWRDWFYSEIYPFTFDTDMTHEGKMETGRMNPVQALLSDEDDMTSFVKGCGGELLRDHFHMDILYSIGQDRDVTIRYGKNLVGLEVTEDMSEVKTRFLCFGKYSETRTLDSLYIEDYLFPKIHVLEDDDKSVDELLAEAQELLDHGADIPKINIKVDFIPLKKTVEYQQYAPLEEVFLGDIVTVIHQKMGFHKKAKIISYEWDCLMEQYNEVELGDFMPSLASSVTSGVRSGSLASAASVTASAVAAALSNHINNKNNPHDVTADQTGGSSGGCSLPDVTAEDDGKVLMVDSGAWTAQELEKYLGEYDVTPTTEAVVLSTANLLMSGDVTVNAIPQSILDAEYQKGYDEAFELFKPYKTALPYIQSNGTQYIDTEFIPNQDTRVVAEVELKIDGSNYFLFGARQYSSNNNTASATFGFNAYQTRYRTHYHNGWTDFETDIAYDTKFTIDVNKNVTTLNGEHSITRTYTAFTAPCTMTIFAVNTAGNVSTYGNAKLYSFKIYDNDVLVRDYIPVLDWNDVPCLYDKVNRKMYYNAGTGTFTYEA